MDLGVLLHLVFGDFGIGIISHIHECDIDYPYCRRDRTQCGTSAQRDHEIGRVLIHADDVVIALSFLGRGQSQRNN